MIVNLQLINVISKEARILLDLVGQIEDPQVKLAMLEKYKELETQEVTTKEFTGYNLKDILNQESSSIQLLKNQ